jgi:hypothetical protein
VGFNAKVTIIAQLLLSVMFVVGYFFVFWLYATGRIMVPDELRDAFSSISGGVTQTLGIVMFFWFQRNRESSTPSNKEE